MLSVSDTEQLTPSCVIRVIIKKRCFVSKKHSEDTHNIYNQNKSLNHGYSLNKIVLGVFFFITMAQTAHHWRKFHANFHLHCVSLWLCVAVLCADRVGQMTKTYSDIDAVTRLLEEVWSGRGEEHTPSTCNPSFTCFIFWISFHLEFMTNWQRSTGSLVKRKSFVKICITITLCSFVFTMIAIFCWLSL